MSQTIATIVRKSRIGRKLLCEVLHSSDRSKRSAREFARRLPASRRGNLTQATDTILQLWRAHDGARRARPHYSRTTRQPRTTEQRLLDRLRSAAISLQHCYRRYARQSGPTVRRVVEFGEAAITCHKEEGWVEYSRRYGNRRGIVDAAYSFALLRGWLGLPYWVRECDGMATVAALRCADVEQPGEEVYRARWGEQARDGVATVNGYIVRQEIDGRHYTAHGRTLGGARGSITAQLPATIAARTEEGRRRAERVERIKAKITARLMHGQLNGYADLEVTLADSRRAGNCPSGTRSWVAKHFPDRESAPIAEVVAVADQRERVLLACLAAIRRQRPDEFRAEI